MSRSEASHVAPSTTQKWRPSAVRALLEEFVPRVWRFALQLTGDVHLADDLTQETMLRAWRHRRSLRNPDSSRAWLFKITANLWRDERRRNMGGPKYTPLSPERQQDMHATPDQQLIRREEVERTLTIMKRLPQRQREVLYLYSCDRLTLAEIADVLGISTDAVKSSLSVARKKMRRELQDLCPNRSPIE